MENDRNRQKRTGTGTLSPDMLRNGREETGSPSPLLSVVVPAYNMAEYLPDLTAKLTALPAVLKRIEILLVDDGSTDPTPAIAEEARNAHPEAVRVIRKENGGHGSCINAGIDAAHGKYFKLVDADDTLDPDALLRHLDFLECRDTDLCVTNYRQVFPDGSARDMCYSGRLREGIEYSRTDMIRALDRGDAMDSPMSFLHMHAITCRTALLRENGIRITERSYYVDQEYIALPLPYVGKIVFQDIFLYHYRCGRPGQSMDPEVFRLHSGMHLAVFRNLVRFREGIGDPVLRDYLLRILYPHSWCYLSLTDRADGFDEVIRFWDTAQGTGAALCRRRLVRHFSRSLAGRGRRVRLMSFLSRMKRILLFRPGPENREPVR